MVGAVLAFGGLVVVDDTRARPNQEALRSIRADIHLGMDRAQAKSIIRKGLTASSVRVTRHESSLDQDFVLVTAGAARSWMLSVTYVDGRVGSIRAGTENGPYLPKGFPPNEP